MLNRLAVLGVFLAAGSAGAGSAPLPPPNTGTFYVGDFSDDEVAVYDGSGAYLRSFTAPGLDGTRGVVVTPEGPIYVASQFGPSGSRVFVFDADETHVATWSHPELQGATGMMRLGDELFVCSFSNARVVVLDLADGSLRRTFTGGGLNTPNCIAADGDGNLYVASAAGGSVVRFNPDETYHSTLSAGTSLSSTMGLAIAADGTLLAAGGSSHTIVRFDPGGAVLDVMSHPDLSGPQGLAFDDRGHLFSSSFYLHRVVEFDATGAYVKTITAGGLNVPRSIAFKPMRVADINDDGRVDVFDLLAVLAAWDDCPTPPVACPADVNDDGTVNVLDLLLVLGDWG